MHGTGILLCREYNRGSVTRGYTFYAGLEEEDNMGLNPDMSHGSTWLGLDFNDI